MGVAALQGFEASGSADLIVGGASPAFLGVESSATGKRWIDRLDDSGRAVALAIAQREGVPDLVARVMSGRGISIDGAAAFLDPTIRGLMPDPAVLTDMERAAARIADAVGAGERVAIFGDYDVDGAASAALMARFLRSQGIDARIYIPDRLFEGYGPNPEAIRALAAEGATLIVAVDCGTTSHGALDTAAGLGVDVVVIDHHQGAAELPKAVAIVNPNRDDDLSGLGHLAAVGLVFMTVVAVNRELRRRGRYGPARPEPDLLAWLDLVALGTVCDVVPLTDLNRAFVVKGLQALQHGRNSGLKALGAAARLSGPLRCHHLGFLLGPRINAGGRIGDAGLGARLLLSDDEAASIGIAAELDRLNGERQAMEAAMLEEAVAATDAAIARGGLPAVVMAASPAWHSGLVGLIAARLKERHGRPAFAVAFSVDGIGTGSGRSLPGVDLGRSVRAAVDAGLLRKGGGHAMAAGLTVERSRFNDLQAFLQEALAPGVAAAGQGADLTIDAALTARGATPDLAEMLERAGPYGAGHPEPVVALPAHRVAYVEPVGQGHLRATLASGDGVTVKAIAFRAVETPLGRALLAARGLTLDIAGSLQADEWRGQKRTSLRIIDVAEPARPVGGARG